MDGLFEALCRVAVIYALLGLTGQKIVPQTRPWWVVLGAWIRTLNGPPTTLGLRR
jgi:hypothetical protein